MTSRARIREHLANAWIFESCSKKELATIVGLGESRHVAAGAVLMQHGDRARECFFVIDGHVRVDIPGLPPKTAGPGTVIGEMALVDGAARSATATAAEDCELFVVHRDRFRDLLLAAPPVAFKLIEVLGLRVRHLERELVKHAPSETPTAT